MDRTSYKAQYSHLFFLLRRVVLVLAIFGLDKQNWALWQVITFWLSSLLVLMFNCSIKPQETRYQRYVEIFNEAMVLLTGYFATQLIMSGRSVAMLQQIGYALAGIISIFIIVTLVLLSVLMLKHTKLFMLAMYKKITLNRRKAKLSVKMNDEIELFSNKSFNDDEKPVKTPMYNNANESLPAINNRDSSINPMLADLQNIIDNKNEAYGTAQKLMSHRSEQNENYERRTKTPEQPNPLEALIRDIELSSEESESPAPVVL